MTQFTAYLCDRSGLIADLHIMTGKSKHASVFQKRAEQSVKALLRRSALQNGGAGSLFVRVEEVNPYVNLSAPELPEGCRHVRDILDGIEAERAREREWGWI